MTGFDTLSLGELIEALEAVEDPGKRVGFDFLDMTPIRLDSYRGFYEHLALEPGDRRKNSAEATVEKLLRMLKEAVGATFTGYKGGVYRMTTETPVWVAFYGDTGDRIVDVRIDEYGVKLITAREDMVGDERLERIAVLARAILGELGKGDDA